MKTTVYSSKGTKESEIELPKVFSLPIRNDIALKVFESRKFALMNPYAVYDEAGKRHSASGKISHRRHKWQGHYGKGISRVPRKKMWRRGTQFYWVGAEVSSARGGRAATPPVGPKAFRKINQKEMKQALASGFAATVNKEYVLKRYTSLTTAPNLAPVITNLPAKTKELIEALKLIFGNAFALTLKHKEVRAGKGKSRGRKYKSNAGLLVVVGKNEKVTFKGLDIKKVEDVTIADLYPLGRLAIYTKTAMEELKNVA